MTTPLPLAEVTITMELSHTRRSHYSKEDLSVILNCYRKYSSGQCNVLNISECSL